MTTSGAGYWSYDLNKPAARELKGAALSQPLHATID
jgi:hypothetical protein